MVVAVILFIVGLGLLIKGGDMFVDSAVNIAARFHVPDLIIGATVVSLGTTLPEVMVSSTSAISGHGQIAYGNAIGSIICNTALIAAITIAVRPSNAESSSLCIPVLFYFVAAAFYCVIAYTQGGFTRATGFVLLGIFLVYMVLTIRQAVAESKAAPSKASSSEGEPEKPFWQDILLLVLGAALVAVGAHLLVDNGTLIAQGLGVPESVIAVTFVALGTSLPELVTAITSLVKGHSSLSLGNIIGANLFNLVLVCGAAISLNPFKIPTEKLLMGRNASFLVDLPLIFLVMGILTFPPLKKSKLYRWQGILLLAIYTAYVIFQFA